MKKNDQDTLNYWKENSLRELDSRLKVVSNIDKKEFPDFHEIVDYALFGGGKRLRPMLCLAAGELVNAPKKETLWVATAIEMIHVYSLCQDDLPSMDNDDYRRGKKSLHKRYGDTMTLLTCDYLVSRSFEIISNLQLDSSKIVELSRALSSAMGLSGLTGGQYLDLHSLPPQNITLSFIEQLSLLKTGSLIQCSIIMGGICGDGYQNQDISNLLSLYGYNLGLAYQIMDDIQDLKQDTVLGMEYTKQTFATFQGIDYCLIRVKNLLDEARKVLTEAEGNTLILNMILDTLYEKLNTLRNSRRELNET